MFIDDDIDFLKAEEAFFKAYGHQVVTADCPKSAIEILKTETPDLIFLDLMMDHYDSGLELCHKIKKDPRLKSIPIIMLSGISATTGHRFEKDSDSFRKWTQIETFIDKPVSNRQLLQIVNSHFEPEGIHK